MEATLKSNITRGSTWRRALYLLLFAVIYSVAEVVLVAVVLFQFGSTLITGRPNQRLLSFGQSLSTFLYQILVYLTYNTEEKPFPFAPWPSANTNTQNVERGASAPKPSQPTDYGPPGRLRDPEQ